MAMVAPTRQAMVERQIAARGVRNPAVLSAMREVRREAFVPPHLLEFAYDDAPLPIAAGQTISQPYVVALMVEALGLRPTDRVLEVGSASGYAAALMSRICRRVFAIERHAELAESSRREMRALGHDNVEIRHGDGTLGWPEAAPFDAILVSAGGPAIPDEPLFRGAPARPVRRVDLVRRDVGHHAAGGSRGSPCARRRTPIRNA